METSHPEYLEPDYIATPRIAGRPEKISSVLERRMKKFVRQRQRRLWQEGKS